MTAGMQEQSPGPIRVLMVVDGEVFDRLGSVVRHLCVGMLEEAVRMTVLSRSVQREADDAIGPARVVNVPQRHRLWPWRRPTAAEVLQGIGGDRPHVVHCLSADLSRWAGAWAAEWKSALAVHLTDMVDIRQFRRCAPPGDGTIGIAATPTIERVLREKHPGSAGQIRVVPFGIPAESEPVCLARPERVPAAAVTTSLTGDCGVGAVFKALKSIVKGGQEVQLFVLAGGPAERRFRRQVDQLGLRSYVTFAGRIGDWTTVREAMRGADFYILPNSRRRFTISTLTAMANGMAVLAPAGTIGDYLIDGETASLFDPQASGQLAEKWGSLLDDRSTARRLAHGALDHIRAHHQASAMVSAIAGVYRELCGLQPAGAGARQTNAGDEPADTSGRPADAGAGSATS